MATIVDYITDNLIEGDPPGDLSQLTSRERHQFNALAFDIQNGCDFDGGLAFEDHITCCLLVLSGRVEGVGLEMVRRLQWCVEQRRKHDLAYLDREVE